MHFGTLAAFDSFHIICFLCSLIPMMAYNNAAIWLFAVFALAIVCRVFIVVWHSHLGSRVNVVM